MMGSLAKFVVERGKSLVSKKVAATAIGVGVVGAQDPQIGGAALMVYVVVQGALDGWRYYVDRRWPAVSR